MSFRKGFFNSLLVSGGYNYATQALLFFSTVVTSRLLSPESFGFVGLINVFTGFVSIFADSGISLAVIRSDYGKTYHRSVDNLAVLLGVALCFITCLIAWPVAIFYGNRSLFLPTVVMSVIFIFKSLSLVRGALLAKAMRFAAIGKITLTTAVLQVALTIVLAYAGWSYWALIVPQIIAALVALLLYERKVQLGYHRCSAAQLKVAYRHTNKTIKNLMGFNLVNYWARNLDNLLVGKFYSVASLGIYNRAYNLLMMPLGLITGLIGNVLFPTLKKVKSEGGDVRKEYLFILKIITIVSFPVSAVLILFPQQFVALLWGPKWMAVSELLPYFGLLLFSQSLLSTTGNILVLMEKEPVMRISGWASAVATIGGIVYGTFHSLNAIAQAYSLAFIVVVLPFNLFYLFIGALRFNKKEMLWFWLPVITASLVIWTGCFFQNENVKLTGVVLLLLLVLQHVRTETGPQLLGFLARKRLVFTAVQK